MHCPIIKVLNPKEIFYLIQPNVWGPFPIATMTRGGGSRYFVVLGMIFLTTLGFISWKIVLKFLPSENAQEYRQRDFLDILKYYGTISHTLFSSISQQNRCVESKLHHILQTVGTLTIVASTPHFWEEASLTMVYTINKCVLHCFTKTNTLWTVIWNNPNYNLLKDFCSACFVLLQRHERTKLQPYSIMLFSWTWHRTNGVSMLWSHC